jgi:hypothetical protein
MDLLCRGRIATDLMISPDRRIVTRDELSCHISRLERSLTDHEAAPVDTLIAQKIAEVKTTSIQCRLEEIRLSQAVRLGLDKHRHMEEVKGWLNQVNKLIDTGDAEAKVLQLENELKEVAIGLRDTVRESSAKVDTLLSSLRASASVIGLQSLTTTRCSICFDNQLDCFIDPCGHTMCKMCASMMNGMCFVCKEQYSAVKPLYFN